MSKRIDGAMQIVRKYALITGGVGSIPILGVDLAAVAATQAKMLADLCAHYGLKFEDNKLKTLIISTLGSFTAFSHGVPGWIVSSLHFLGPIGIVLKPIYSSGVTYALGNIFVTHFEAGGTLENFNPANKENRAKFRESLKTQPAPVATSAASAEGPTPSI